MYILISKREESNQFDTTEVIFKVDTCDLTELVEKFEYFLKACGFSLNGHLDIVKDDK